jgi:hypothetical protein
MRALANTPTLHAVYREVEPHLNCRFCIAGGAVRDIVHGYKPRDWDLFCFSYPTWRTMAKRYRADPRETHQYRDALCMTFRWHGETIQVIHRHGLRTIPALLEEFDWTCCMYAFDGVQVRVHDDTGELGPGKLLKLNDSSTPEKALERGRMFAKRFGMEIEPASLATLDAKLSRSGRLKAIAKRMERMAA